MSNVARFVCWKWNPYKSELHPRKQIKFNHLHVNNMLSMLERNSKIPIELTCVTDDPTGIDPRVRIIPLWDNFRDMGGCYVRLKSFSLGMKSVFGPDFFSIDLDTVIVGDITQLIEDTRKNYDFKIWGDTNPTTPYNGSFYYMKAGARKQVWEKFDRVTTPKLARGLKYFGTDQACIGAILGTREPIWTTNDGVYSYRVHMIQRNLLNLRGKERIVFFHGAHDPCKEDTQLLSPWIKDHWK